MVHDAPARDWREFDGCPMVEAIDRLYAQQVESLAANSRISWLGQKLRRDMDGEWWSAYGPPLNEYWVALRAERLPPGAQGELGVAWQRRVETLRTAFKPLFGALCSGEVVVEGDGNHETGYAVLTIPPQFWRVEQWLLYRWLAPNGPQLYAVNILSDSARTVERAGPIYFNPRLRIGPSSTAAAPPSQPDHLRKPSEPASPAERLKPEAVTAVISERLPLVTATTEAVREAARAVYRDHNQPNMRNAEKLIREVLRASGRRPGKDALRDVLREDQFAKQRRDPGPPKRTPT